MLIDDRYHRPEREPLHRARLQPGSVATALLLLPVAAGSWMTATHGGYHVSSWGPAALVMLGLLALLLLATSLPRRTPVSRWTWIGGGSVVAFAAWSAASISWASDPSVAWEAAGRSTMYAAFLLVTILLARVPGISFRVVLGTWVTVTALVAAATLVLLPLTPDELVRSGRLIGTVGYFNAEATMLLLPTWAALWLAADRTIALPLRIGVVGAAALCACVSLLAQSRGSIVALAVAGLLYLILAPRRLHAIGILVAIVAAGSLMIGPADALHADFSPEVPTVTASVAADAAQRAWIAAGVGSLLGACWLLLADLLARRTARRRLPARVVGAAVAATILIAAIGLGRSDLLDRAVTDLRTPTISAGDDASRLTNMSSNGRFQLWDTSFEVMQLHPIRGVGAGSWEPWYYQLRDHEGAYVRQPHNLTLEVLSEHGMVGGVLLLVFVVAVGAQVLPRRIDPPRTLEHAGLVAAASATFTQWIVHAQLEWLWQLPAATWPAMLAAGILLAAPWQERVGQPAPRTAHAATRVGAAMLVAAAAAAVAAPWMADRLVSHAAALRSSDPEAAAASIIRAEQLNPVSSDAARERLALARSRGDADAAMLALHDYVARAPEHWATYASIAVQLDDPADRPLAQRMRSLARSHNPRGFEFTEAARAERTS